MIVTTKFHDITFEELRTRHLAGECTSEIWEQCRGRVVHIKTPGASINCLTDTNKVRAIESGCEGPFYEMVERPTYMVCHHTVEIGD